MDTLIVLLMLFTTKIDSVKPIQENNQFTELFNKADQEFNKKYKLNIDLLKKASQEAVISAEKKTYYLKPKYNKLINQ